MTPIEFIRKASENHFRYNYPEPLMINASEMAKPYSRNPLEFTIDREENFPGFTYNLMKMQNLSLEEVMFKDEDGDFYMNRILALKFGNWLEIKAIESMSSASITFKNC